MNSWYNCLRRIPQHHVLSVRVLCACALSLALTEMAGLPRNYWSILAIVSVSMSVHTRELVFRSRSIILYTITGCLLGTMMHYALSFWLDTHLMIACILILALMNLYFTVVNYSVGVFFNSLFTVMFVGVLSYWDFGLFIARIFDITIGALMMLFMSLWIRPKNLIADLIENIHHLYQRHQRFIETLMQEKTVPYHSELLIKKKPCGHVIILAGRYANDQATDSGNKSHSRHHARATQRL